MAEVNMPQLGETVTEATVTRWFKAVGDRVAADEPLFEVSSDKVDSEVPAPASGFLAEILVEEGATVGVGAKLAVLSDQAPDGASPPDGAPPSDEPEPELVDREPEPVEAPSSDGASSSDEPEPVDREPERVEPEPAAPEPEPAAPEGGRGADGARLASPLVRRLLRQHDLDAAAVEGSGPGGRITRNDVLAVIEADGGSSRRAPASPEGAKAPARPAPAAAAPAASRGDDEVIAFTNIRRRTAEHMVASLATSAHTLVVVDADFNRVEKVRIAARERFRAEEGVSLNYLPFVSRAVVDAIRTFPRVNASVGENALVVHHRIHLGIAVDLNLEGLMVPVLHDADTMRLRALARGIADLAARARETRLGPDDIAGGTFTITNPGPFGTLLTAPVINQPQVAILATDGVRKRPVAVPAADGGDAIAVHPVGNLALSFDHRAIDGAYASAFLAKVKEIIETRDWSAELS